MVRLTVLLTGVMALSLVTLALLPFINVFLHTLRQDHVGEDEKVHAKTSEVAEALSRLKATTTLFDQFMEEREKRKRKRYEEHAKALEARNGKPSSAQIKDNSAPANLGAHTSETLSEFKSGPIQEYMNAHNGALPVLVVCHNRPNELGRTLDGLLKLKQTDPKNILVVQDGSMASVKAEVDRRRLTIIQNTELESRGMREDGERIAQHYRFALSKAFEHFADSPGIIVMEDDLHPSPDFFDWFYSGARVMESDPSLWCVSAWNDNGFKRLVKDDYAVRRTILFPGLGWLLSRKEYQETLGPGWPKDHWDWYIRGIYQRRNRECLYPEIPRTFHHSRTGTFVNENDQKTIFDKMARNEKTDLDWRSPDAESHLVVGLLRKYDERYIQILSDKDKTLHVRSATDFPGQVRACAKGQGRIETLVVWYTVDPDPRWESTIKLFTNFFGIWHQLLRSSHEGLHEIYYEGCRVLLVNVFTPGPMVQSTWFTSYPHQTVYIRIKPDDLKPFEPQDFASGAVLGDATSKNIFAAEHFGESCTDTCRARGLKCSLSEFARINACSVVEKYLPCVQGCQQSEGPDQPCVVKPDAPMAALPATCLVSSSFTFDCDGRHPLTRRLCPCSS